MTAEYPADLPLRLSNVFKHFPGKSVLNGVDLLVPRGAIVGLLGRNGAGKTTLIECALGLRDTDHGEVALFGQAPSQLDADTKGRIGYVPQESDLFEWMTVEDMLAFFEAFYHRWNRDKVCSLLDRWSLRPSATIGKLSGGEKQRLSIVRALAHDPELLVLDEPVASLDPAGRRDFLRELVDSTLERGTTVLFSTHILSDLERVAVNAAFLRDGRIVLQDDLDVIAERCVRLTAPAATLASLEKGQVLATSETGDLVTLLTQGDERLRAQWRECAGVRVEPIGLEDLFIEVTR